MKTRITLAAALTLFALPAFAGLTEVNQSLGFSQNMTQIPGAGELYVALDFNSSNEWDPAVVESATPFSGFKSFETWNVQSGANETAIYVSEIAVTLQKGLDQIQLDQLESISFMSSIDPAFENEETTPQAFNEAYVAAMTESYESAKRAADALLKRRKITQNQYTEQVAAIEAQHQTNISAKWCQDPSVKCLTSKAAFPSDIVSYVMPLVQLATDFPDHLRMYSELRKMTAEELQAQGMDAGTVQLTPLVNKGVVNMKNFVMFKRVSDAETVMVIKSIAVFEKDDLDKFSFIGSYNFILGESSFNTDEGIFAGFPPYLKKLAETLKNTL